MRNSKVQKYIYLQYIFLKAYFMIFIFCHKSSYSQILVDLNACFQLTITKPYRINYVDEQINPRRTNSQCTTQLTSSKHFFSRSTASSRVRSVVRTYQNVKNKQTNKKDDPLSGWLIFTWSVIPVQDGEGEESTVSVCSKRGFGEG